jgi:hypothetical protein
MRSVEQVRTRLLERLQAAVRRPRMWGGRDHEVHTVLHALLDELCFIDEREEELDLAIRGLHSRQLFRSTGIRGAFDEVLRDVPDFSHEVASVFAEIAGWLGYLALARRLPVPEWQLLQEELPSWCQERDRSPTEVTARFGEPSLVSGSVACYAPEDPRGGWIFFDFCPGKTGLDEHGNFFRREDVLRDVRIPAADLTPRFHFTPHGHSHACPRRTRSQRNG